QIGVPSMAARSNIFAASSSPLPSDGAFLQVLGKRVRQARDVRGMTRKALAVAADVSERHLAQLESGEGNVSIVLLRRIAKALEVSLSDLFSSEMNEAVEKRLILQLLGQLPAHRLEEVVYRLTRDFGQEEKARQMRVALIGLRGAGKSTLGARLGEAFRITFIELDREIEKETGMPLAEIFAMYGQAGYRSIERRTFEHVLKQHERAVLSISGGVVSEKENY